MFEYAFAYLYSWLFCIREMCAPLQVGQPPMKSIVIPIVVDGKLLRVRLQQRPRKYYSPSVYRNDYDEELEEYLEIALNYDIRLNREVELISCDTMSKCSIKL